MEFISSLFLLSFVFLVPKLRNLYLFPKTSSPSTKSKKRLSFFDFAKGIAIIAVILIHATYLFLLKYPDYNPYWLDVINNISRFAVGFFFVTSGALLTSGLSKKKLLRVFVPYLVACVIIGISLRSSPNLIIGGIARGDLLPPYYFIPVLFQFYLIFPILNKLRNNKYFLVASLLISYFFYLNSNLWYFAGIPFFGRYLFLFTFGMAYSEKLKSKKPIVNIDSWLIIILVYLVLLFLLPGRYYNSRFFYAPALFVVFHYLWNKISLLRNLKIIQTFGYLSLWIYLIHFSIESYLINAIPFSFNYPIYLYVVLIFILTTAGSGAAARLFAEIYKFSNPIFSKKYKKMIKPVY